MDFWNKSGGVTLPFLGLRYSGYPHRRVYSNSLFLRIILMLVPFDAMTQTCATKATGTETERMRGRRRALDPFKIPSSFRRAATDCQKDHCQAFLNLGKRHS